MNSIRIQNRQRRHRIDRPALRRLGQAILQCAARRAPAWDWRSIDVLLVDNAGIAPINAAAVGHEGPTDVITLPYEAIPGEPSGATAEIVLNVERAWQQGGAAAHGADRELALYLAHACDHLRGHDDATPAGRRSMRRREWRWLKQTGIPRLFEDASCAT